MIHTTLISTDTVARHLDGDWVIVDCRFDLRDEDLGRTQYLSGHIPGAVYASLSRDLATEKTGQNGRHPLPAVDVLAATIGRLGIARGTQVVAYDQDAGMFASRFWWMLRYLGHDQVAVLDGGWAKWTHERRPTRTGEETRPTARFVPSPRTDRRVTVDEVERRLGDPSVMLVDARGPDRFEGRSEPLDRVAGHIPGAANHYYKLNLDEAGTMLPPDRLHAAYAGLLGGRPPGQVVMYCGSGVSACHNLLAMEHAGLPGARLYSGSWSEWSSDPARPVESGTAK